ncbi:MAG: LysR family transcriptional regulator [Desulfobulbaceae bacterium A2]|nr:MAG: LysR family transcriptional regulator [Desulfobulbaceae bacterium A2]
MELRHLRYFVAVAEELHFGRAAERLHMAQPPLSQQIRALEEELGVRLFVRTSRSVSLTPAGASFAQDARATLARVEEAARLARRIHRGEAGEIRVGYMNPVMDAVLCRALATFRVSRPELTLRLRELPSPTQLEELRAGRLDVAFIRLVAEPGGQDLRGLASRVVLREPYVLAMPKGHRLARLSVIPLRQAGTEPLILFPRSAMPVLHDVMLAALRDSGATPEIAQEVMGKHASLALVAAGLGVCLVPASARDWRRQGVVLRPLEPGLPEVEMAAVWPEGADNAAVQALVEAAA